MDLMAGSKDCCSNSTCGCSVSVYPTDEKCPDCGRRLSLRGNLMQASFRLACSNCGFQGALLSQEQLHALL